MSKTVAVLLLATLSSTAIAVAQGEDGKSIYLQRCAFCHGADGKGDGPAGQSLNPPPANFTAADWWKRTNPEQVRQVIENGKDGSAMVPFKQLMSPAQIDAVIKHLETFRPTS